MTPYPDTTQLEETVSYSSLAPFHVFEAPCYRSSMQDAPFDVAVHMQLFGVPFLYFNCLENSF